MQVLGVKPVNTNQLKAFGFSIIILMFTIVTWERTNSWLSWLWLAGGLMGLGIAIFQKKWPD
jgi:hypothetical protein